MWRWVLLVAAALSLLLLMVTKPAPFGDSRLYAGTEGYPWWNDTVFYEVFVRSFYDSDNDGNGDLNGLIEKLDYLNDGDPTTQTDLGVTGLWLMPISPSSSYHGYDVTDYYGIHPDYGSMEDFKRLLTEAHRRGIRVIVDLVLNHTGIEHPWFVSAAQGPDSPYRNYFLWRDDDPGYANPQGATAWNPAASGYYYAAFWREVPDLNLQNPDVVRHIEDITRFWLREVGVDGFRLDAVKHFVEEGAKQENTPGTHRWMKEYHRMYKAIAPRSLTVGEVWSPSREVAPYITEGELDLAFEFDTAQAMIAAAQGANANRIRIAHAVASRLYPANQYATFLSNHDQNRVMSQLDGDLLKARVAAGLLLTGPGVPFVYYGEEVGMTGLKPDPDLRVPMQWENAAYAGFSAKNPWRAPNEPIGPLNVADQDLDPDSLLNHYRRLIHLRQGHPALRMGVYAKVESSNPKVYAFLRQSRQEQVLVVINLSGQEIGEYGLDYGGSLGDITSAVELLHELDVPPPALDDQGGFARYHPLESLAPAGVWVIQLR